MTDAPAPHVLRVLNGRLAGTEKMLPPCGTLSIGYQFWQDVVIRDPATRGIALDVSFDETGAAQLVVLIGEASLLGSTLSAGQTALLLLAALTPTCLTTLLRLRRVAAQLVFGVGHPDAARRCAAERIA